MAAIPSHPLCGRELTQCFGKRGFAAPGFRVNASGARNIWGRRTKMSGEKEEKGFVIKDRRIFSDDKGESVKESTEESEPVQAPPDEAEAQPAEDAGQPEGEAEQAQLPEINFPTFIFSLNSSALVHLGALDDPSTGKKEKNLPLAKQTIDILGILEEKTKGNLTEDEENFLKNILHDLRLMYVRELK